MKEKIVKMANWDGWHIRRRRTAPLQASSSNFQKVSQPAWGMHVSTSINPCYERWSRWWADDRWGRLWRMTASWSTKYMYAIRTNFSPRCLPEFNRSLVRTWGRLCFDLLKAAVGWLSNICILYVLDILILTLIDDTEELALSTYLPLSRNWMGAGIAVELNRYRS